MIFYRILFSIFSVHLLLSFALTEKCIKQTEDKWTTCIWKQWYITKEIQDWQKLGTPSCASMAVTTILQISAELHFQTKKQIDTQSFLDCFGSCDISNPLAVLINLRVHCQQRKDKWQKGLLFNTNVYPPYDGETHLCRIRNFLELIAPVCISYDYYAPETQTQIESIGQLISLIEYGPLLAVLHVKSGFRNFEGDVYDQNKDPTAMEETRHALVIIGYRQKDPKKIQIRVRNPWTNKQTGLPWGDNGHAWIVIRSLQDMELNSFLSNVTMYDKNENEN